MQYMLKFSDPEQNLASMDELIQSGVDLLDLLPPEEGGVKPRFSNPSNDWKYDLIARYVDACNPVSECTCRRSDGRPHDVHLCSVHHDTVSQDSDTLTMDNAEGNTVNIPTIKLHSTYTEVKTTSEVKTTHSKTNTNNNHAVLTDNSTKTQSQQHNSDSTDKSIPVRTKPSSEMDIDLKGHGQIDNNGSYSEGHSQNEAEVNQNSTVVAEVHVDGTSVKPDNTRHNSTHHQGDKQQNAQGKFENVTPNNPVGQTKVVVNDTKTSNPHSNPNATTNASTTGDKNVVKTMNPDKSPTVGVDSSNVKDTKETKVKDNMEKFISRPTTTSVQDHRKRAFTKRPSLPIEPRTTQYQKHALLQERSDTGVLEFELLLAERDREQQEHRAAERTGSAGEATGNNPGQDPPRKGSLNARKCSLDSSRMKLLPRTNQYEPHPLLRKTNSGMSEIEEVLQEKEQEFIKRMKEKRDSMDSSRPDPAKFTLHRGSLGRLEPRLGQYEKHSLLQSKDEDGKTALEMFLEEELVERKASVAENDTNYSDKEKLAPKRSNASDCSSAKGSIKKSRSKSSSLKKVHFERSGSKDKKKKPDESESGISKGEVSSTSDPKPDSPEGQGHSQGQPQGGGQEADNGYDTDDDDKTEEDRLTGERAKAKLNKDQGKCCTIL